MTTKPADIATAEYLVCAFLKSWTWRDFSVTAERATGVHPKEFPFISDSRRWNGSVLIRAYVAQNWPKLFTFLDGPADIKTKLAAATEIVKLHPTVERPQGAITTKERAELNRTKKKYRADLAANKLSVERQRAGGRHNWNQCK